MSDIQATRSEVQREPSHGMLNHWFGAIKRDLVGIRFALNVFVASTVVWYTLERILDTNPIWTIASMIAASDPEVKEAARMFKCRIINVLVGCSVGLLFLIIGGSSQWKLPFRAGCHCPPIIVCDPNPEHVASGAHYRSYRHRRWTDTSFKAKRRGAWPA